LQAFLPLAMEIAPFKRAGRSAKARELLKPLHKGLLAQLEPPVEPLFDDLVDLYTHSAEGASLAQVRDEVQHGLRRLAETLAAVGARLVFAVDESDQDRGRQ
jgi:hypothetical protein